ncbi:MAG: hypothetical protein ACOH1X_02740 [Kaistella sp.]
MAKIKNINAIKDIHLDIGGTFDYIDANLPEKYSRETLALLPLHKKVDPAYIRIVKKYRIKNEAIINALYRVAQWNELQKDKS